MCVMQQPSSHFCAQNITPNEPLAEAESIDDSGAEVLLIEDTDSTHAPALAPSPLSYNEMAAIIADMSLLVPALCNSMFDESHH
jgi:hypothetical protein